MQKRKPTSYQMLRCKNCGGQGHTAWRCFEKRKPIRKESKKHLEKRLATSSRWFSDNPSDSSGFWYCYLNISKRCPRRLDKSQLTLEHVYPKGKYPALAFYEINLKPACSYCNKEKLSNTINKLRIVYPHLNEMIATSEWQEWEDSMEALALQLGILLDRPPVEPPEELGLD